jgi:hypothetical protein
MVIGRDHQRDIFRIDSRHLGDYRVPAQVQQTADVERIVIWAGNLLHRVILEPGIGDTGIPAALLERKLVVDIIHRHVLVGAADEVLNLCIAEFHGSSLNFAVWPSACCWCRFLLATTKKQQKNEQPRQQGNNFA